MDNISPEESELIRSFLTQYKQLLNKEGIPFNPRSIVMVSQPNLNDETEFHWIGYNHWFDELGVEASVGTSTNILSSFLDCPINVLISAEEVGKDMLSKKDRKKLLKALKLLSEIKIERQNKK
jgi:hypothetical protein